MRVPACLVLCLVLLFAVSSTCPAESESIGTIKSVNDSASIVRSGETIPAKVGQAVQAGDTIQTGPDGSIGLIFKDDTIISLGPDSEFIIEEFLFEPVEGDLSFVAEVIQGTVALISGQIAKLSPDSVQLEIPAATIGVRGTQILISVEGN